MSMPRQYTLALDQPHQQILTNFVPGANAELLQALQKPAEDFCGYWIYGGVGSGRSHLLRGCCLRALDEGLPVSYVGCADYRHPGQGLVHALTHAGGYGHLVALDDIGGAAGSYELEASILAIYQRLLEEQGRLLITHSQPAGSIDFALPDLASRMCSLQHYQIRELSDQDKKLLLRKRAESRGYELTQPVLDYWLVRGPRDLDALLTDLETLDKASLAQQKKVTIPLLKQVLGY